MNGDGWRAVPVIDSGGAMMRNSAGRQVTDALPELAGLVDTLDGRAAIPDRELVACPDGRPELYAPHRRHASSAATHEAPGRKSDQRREARSRRQATEEVPRHCWIVAAVSDPLRVEPILPRQSLSGG